MEEINCVLLTEGPSDVALKPIVLWVVQQYHQASLVECEWADWRRFPLKSRDLAEKICAAVEHFRPCHILFIHRDADRQPPERRYDEIQRAVAAVKKSGLAVPYICVVPVREQEAWLLFDEPAIRKAVGNPNGSVALQLPALSTIEAVPDPKALLYKLLQTASERHGRRLKKFDPGKHAWLVSEQIADFSPLRALSAFQRLEADVKNLAWDNLPRSGTGNLPKKGQVRT
jgi:hypothetical protein